MARTLYVGKFYRGLPRLRIWRMLFSAHGEVLSSRVITDRETGRSRGFGFVEVRDEDAESMIAAMNGTELNGRVITVNEAKSRDDRAEGMS